MFVLYNCLLPLAVVILTPYLAFKFAVDSRFRTGLAERFGFLSRDLETAVEGKGPVWFHAASVGEVAGSAKLLGEIRRRWPEKRIIVSTFTSTGRETAKKVFDADGVFILPFDLPFLIGRVLKRIRPQLLIVMETELWPNLIIGANNRGTPVVLVNGRISARSFGGYRFFRPLLKRLFGAMSLLLARSEEDRGRMVSLGADPAMVRVTGNLKFDIDTGCNPLEFMEGVEGPLVIAGSTHKGEDAPLLDTYIELRKRHMSLKLVLAPRHPDRTGELERLLSERGIGYVKRSALSGRFSSDVLLLDTLGELPSLYRYGDAVFVGGSLVPVGGHNVLEPALSGKPVIFGPYMDNFREEAEILTSCGGSGSVKNPEELGRWIDRLLSDGKLRAEMGKRAKETVLKNQGATERTLQEISRLLA